MAHLVRTICDFCASSVEISRDGSDPLATRCNHCGHTVEIPISASDDPTDDYRPDRSDDTADYIPGRTRAVNDWSRICSGQLGPFQIKRLLGSGGYGDVYLALDTSCDRYVALKVLRETKVDARRRKRFENEARSASRIEHDGVVRLYSKGCDDGRLWIAYEFVRGKTLEEMLNEREFLPQEAVRIVIDIAEALAFVHRRRLTHRDVKPANIMMTEAGKPKVTDLGLARSMDEDSGLTDTTAVIGSRDYMSPEQAAGLSRRVDGRSDVYSLGVILFRMLCGRLPTEDPDSEPGEGRRIRTRRVAPRMFEPSVPLVLDEICADAIEIDPERRPQSMLQFAARLRSWLDLQNEPRPIRRRLKTVGAVVAAAALMATGGVGLRMMFPTPPARSTDPAPPVTPHPVVVAAKPPEPKFFGNPNSRTLHRAGCSHLKTMRSEPIAFLKSAEAVDVGYKPCSTCHPDRLDEDKPLPREG